MQWCLSNSKQFSGKSENKLNIPGSDIRCPIPSSFFICKYFTVPECTVRKYYMYFIDDIYRYVSLNDGDTFWEMLRRRFRRCANVIQCTYTNLDSIAYYRYASLNDGDSEKCVVRRFRRCANVIQCTYTNLDSIAYYRYASLNDGVAFWEMRR